LPIKTTRDVDAIAAVVAAAAAVVVVVVAAVMMKKVKKWEQVNLMIEGYKKEKQKA